MNIFNIFNSKRLNLPTRQARRQTKRKVIKALAGPHYKVVTGWAQTQREQGQTENVDEDHILD